MMTAYETLGVGKDATQEEIKKAYLAKSRKHHPDRKGGCLVMFKELVAAFDCLKNPEERKYYDEHGAKRRAVNKIETDVAAMVIECCLQTDEPVRWMMSRVKDRETQFKKHRDGCLEAIRTLENNKRSFLKRNKKSPAEKVEFICGVMENELGNHEKNLKKIEENLKHMEDLRAYLTCLENEKTNDMNKWESVSSTTFSGMGWSNGDF